MKCAATEPRRLFLLTFLIVVIQLCMYRWYLQTSPMCGLSTSATISSTPADDALSQCHHLLNNLQRTLLPIDSSHVTTTTTRLSSFFLRPDKATTTATMSKATLPSLASFSSSSSTMTKSTSISSKHLHYQQKRYCSSQVLGEKQVWNPFKKVLSYAVFGPTITNTKPSWNANTTNTTTLVFPDWVIHGMERNILDAQYYYPDWIVRVHAFDLPPEIQDRWLNPNATIYYNVEVVQCYSNTLLTTSNSRKMLSRLLAYDDPKVWYTLPRDADSRLSLREVMAVHEFLQASMMEMDHFMPHHNDESLSSSSQHHHSDHHDHAIYFHVMRDHPDHIVPVMGGMMGMKRGLLQHAATLNATSMFQLVHRTLQRNPRHLGGVYGEDQQFLRNYLWPHVRHVTLDHDMMLERCQRHRSKHCREFPLGPRDESIDYFVGSGFKEKDEQQQEWRTKHVQHTCVLQCNLTKETSAATLFLL